MLNECYVEWGDSRCVECILPESHMQVLGYSKNNSFYNCEIACHWVMATYTLT